MQIDTTIPQIKDLLANPNLQRVLVTSGKNVDPDAVGSVLALAQALTSQGKQVITAIEDFDPASMSFMPGVESILSTIGAKSLVISIDVGAHPIEKINYNAENTKFNLVLTPSGGQVTTDQISYSYTGLNVDLIFVVDTASQQLLGDWATDFQSELATIPLINIDHHADNQRFGTLNLIDASQPSASLIVGQLIQELGLSINQTQSTNLLAGLISDTAGFVNRNTTADSLRQAASLVEAGADLPGLMKNLFRTMSLAALQLWGLVLSRVQRVQDIIITEVYLQDITQTQATEADQETLGNLVNSFVTAVPGAKLALVLKEKDDASISGSLRSIDPSVNVQTMARQLNGGGHVLASGFRLPSTTMAEARQKALQVIQQELDRQNLSSGSAQHPKSSKNTQEEAPRQPQVKQSRD